MLAITRARIWRVDNLRYPARSTGPVLGSLDFYPSNSLHRDVERMRMAEAASSYRVVALNDSREPVAIVEFQGSNARRNAFELASDWREAIDRGARFDFTGPVLDPGVYGEDLEVYTRDDARFVMVETDDDIPREWIARRMRQVI